MTSSFSKTVVRFAPSPNGYLHLGHAYSAVMNGALAADTGGRFLLRMENIDVTRCRPEFETALLEDLTWLGLRWEEPVWRQSDHFGSYATAMRRLERRGLVYPCFCSRGDIMSAVASRPRWPLDPDGTPLYPGTCKHMSPDRRAARFAAGERASYRLDMDRALNLGGRELSWGEYRGGSLRFEERATPEVWGDAVLSRKDIATSYHIAVVIDDAAQGVTDIVRGEDLFMATNLHRVLQALLDLPTPNYHHHALIRDSAGQKLAKSLRAKPLRSYRHEGFSREDVLTRLGLSARVSGLSMRV